MPRGLTFEHEIFPGAEDPCDKCAYQTAEDGGTLCSRYNVTVLFYWPQCMRDVDRGKTPTFRTYSKESK